MIRPLNISTKRLISSRPASFACTLMSINSLSMWLLSLRSTSLITSTSLFNCLVICSMICSEPVVTRVILDTVASSVGATVRDSILNPRAENSPETRDRAPDSFSISNDNICLTSDASSGQFPVVGEMHLVMGLARGDHGVYVLGLIGNAIHQNQPVLHGEGL